MMSVVSGVAQAALVGGLQVVIGGYLVRSEAQAEMLKAGQRVEGRRSLRGSCGPAVLARPLLAGCLALIGCRDIHHPP